MVVCEATRRGPPCPKEFHGQLPFAAYFQPLETSLIVRVFFVGMVFLVLSPAAAIAQQPVKLSRVEFLKPKQGPAENILKGLELEDYEVIVSSPQQLSLPILEES